MVIRYRFCACFAVGTCLLLSGWSSFACDCEQTSATEMIFEGTVERQEVSSGSIGASSGVLSMTERSEHRVVTMRLVRVYRGDAQVRVTVITGLGTGDCGFDFENGRTYLVYAERLKGDVLFTSICMATASVEESGAALRLLRGEPPLPEDFVDSGTRHREFLKKTMGSVCGRVIMPDGKPLGDAVVELLRVREEPLPAETLERHSDTDNSKEDGSFCVKGSSPGKYLLDALDNDLPDNTRWVGYYCGQSACAAGRVALNSSGTRLPRIS